VDICVCACVCMWSGLYYVVNMSFAIHVVFIQVDAHASNADME
jgi:hypothetical protein